MRRWLLLMGLAGVIGGLTATLPALTAAAGSTLPMTGSFTVGDFAFTAAGGGSTVSIAPGGTVSFSYPSGSSEHNVDFGTGPQPTSCAVGGSAQAPPVPSTPTSPGWSATCTFDDAGTYTFHCDRHTFMTGTIEVGAQTTTTATGPGDTGTAADTTATMTMPMSMPMSTTSTSPSSPLSPIVGSARSAIQIVTAGAGRRIDGSIKVSDAGHGGHAAISVLASSAAVEDGAGSRAVIVGRLRIDHLRAGTVDFTLELKPAVRRALTTRRRLPITVEITIAARGAQTVRTSRSLVLRA